MSVTNPLKLMAAAVLAFSAMAAQAASICESCNDLDTAAGNYIGSYDPTTNDTGSFGHNLGPDTDPNSAFFDFWIFDLDPSGSGTASANFTTSASITDFGGEVFVLTGDDCDRASFVTGGSLATGCNAGATGISVGAASTSGGGDLDWEIALSDLAAGTYIIVITGTTNGTDNSAYTGQLSFQTVPEPGSLALLGLGLLGLAAFRRRQPH